METETLLLGGGSFKNKAWVEETQEALKPEVHTSIVYWNDWANGADANINFAAEIAKASEVVGDKPFNLLAKSVGSYVGTGVIKEHPDQIQKVILCGVPLRDFEREDLKNQYTAALQNIPVERILVIQNEKDSHGSYEEVAVFMAEINPDIKVVKKTVEEYITTHNYPYPEDFKAFLNG